MSRYILKGVLVAHTICLPNRLGGRRYWWASAATLALLVEHSQISGRGGQRLVSVIQ
jgi:hypothetical protein